MKTLKRPVLPVEIRGTDLPGRRCGPNPQGQMYENVHVGMGRGDGMVGLIPGDAPSASWQIDVAVRVRDEGDLDFGGPLVRGKRGERFLYLSWGTVDPDGTFTLFRAAKLWLSDIPRSVVQEALRPGRRLVGSLGLTDCKGYPRCAGVRPPDIVWTVEDRSSAPPGHPPGAGRGVSEQAGGLTAPG